MKKQCHYLYPKETRVVAENFLAVISKLDITSRQDLEKLVGEEYQVKDTKDCIKIIKRPDEKDINIFYIEFGIGSTLSLKLDSQGEYELSVRYNSANKENQEVMSGYSPRYKDTSDNTLYVKEIPHIQEVTNIESVKSELSNLTNSYFLSSILIYPLGSEPI